MGLASSQARLLSITARLTDNEYRTQRLTNARLKLTDISDAARVKYQDALQTQQFQYMSYDATGDRTNIAFTPAVVWQYQPCKNQYALMNQSGNVLVSSVDAKNFRETDNLAEFLKRYDCLEKIVNSDTKIIEKSHEEVNPAYAEWEAAHPPVNDVFTDETLSNMFLEASYECYSAATNTATHCYEHVLAHLLFLEEGGHYPTGYMGGVYSDGPFMTTTGDNLDASLEHSYLGHYINSAAINICGYSDDMIPLAVALREGYQPEGADEKYTILASKMPLYDEIRDEIPDEAFKNISEYYIRQGTTDKNKILMSNYYKDENGIIRLKSLKQKCIDVFYLINAFEIDYNRNHRPGETVETYIYNGINYKKDLVPIIKTIQVDLKHFTLDMGEYNPYSPTITVPDEPEIITNTEEKIIIKDPEKAQWYTNLWYRMNGMNDPERIYKNSIETTNDRQEEVTETEYLLTLYDIKKNTYNTCYQEIPSNLASSKSWLNDALAQGWITMQKVGVSRTADKDEFKWSDIIYSNATDIILEQDDDAIAKAEAAYNQALAEVNAKDKVFENKIRKLDTEHNALQTEYNSVKSALDKNVERSFKTFQG